jgi:rubrerythrin
MNIFDCAIKKEEEARMYYEQLAANTAVPELKNLFTMLAESEQEHHDALVALKESKGHIVAEFKDLQGAACHFTPLLAKKDLKVEPLAESDAYLKIVTEEEEGIQFYVDLAEQTTDENARKALHMIAKEERKHLSIVKNIYSFVESPKNFQVSAEFTNLKNYEY